MFHRCVSSFAAVIALRYAGLLGYELYETVHSVGDPRNPHLDHPYRPNAGVGGDGHASPRPHDLCVA